MSAFEHFGGLLINKNPVFITLFYRNLIEPCSPFLDQNFSCGGEI